MTERIWRTLGRAAAAGLALAAMPLQASDDIAADWRTLLDKGDREAVYATYGLIDRVRDEHGEIAAAPCRELAGEIAAALETNPVGLAVWYMAQECARASGDTALAQQRLERFEALLKHTFAARGLDDDAPMPVLSERDAEAVIAASGQTELYALYMPYDGGRHLSYLVGLWDEETQRESILEFDYLDAAMALRHALPEAEFPMFRRDLVSAMVESAASHAPGSPLAQLAALEQLESQALPNRVETLAQLAADGHLMAAIALAIACEETPALACHDRAVDALLPLAEKRHALALVALAYVYVRNSDRPADLKAARSLIEQADRRLGSSRASAALIGFGKFSQRTPHLIALVERNLDRAASDGDLMAGLGLAVSQYVGKGQLAEGKHLRRVVAAAEAGLPQAQYWYARTLLAQKKIGEAAAWMRRAAENGFPAAQSWLGFAHYRGENGVARDVDRGLEWLRRAAHGGQSEASVLIGQHYLQQSDEVVNLQRARDWLLSAALAENIAGGIQLARLLERDIEGVGSPAQAVKIYEALIHDHDSARARVLLAKLLIRGKGIAEDRARAETLLRGDAQQGVTESQLALGLLLLQATESAPRRAAGVEWLRKASAAGSPKARDELATVLWYGRGAAPEPAAALQLWQGLMAEGAEPMAANNFAWAHCTARDPALLDAAAGLAAIAPLGSREDAPLFFVGTLASCQAASGDFAAAVATQQRAIGMLQAREQPSAKLLQEFRARLAQYESGQRTYGDER